MDIKEMGRLGGKASAAKLTFEQRQARARKAGESRTEKKAKASSDNLAKARLARWSKKPCANSQEPA